jgi:methylmalonyl-CoA mutase N-terminal domain/subunit
VIAGIETGFFRREIAEAAYAYQRDVDAKRKLIVGVNAFVERDEKPLDTLQIDASVEHEQVASLRRVKDRRSGEEVRRTLDKVKKDAAANVNLLPALIDAARARTTVGETVHALAEVFGRYQIIGTW